MHTLLICIGYVVYFIIVMVNVGLTCDVNEYLTNENYKKAVFHRLDVPLTVGLIAALTIWFFWV